MMTKTLQLRRHIFLNTQAGTITISVGMLEIIHVMRELNKLFIRN